jgi:hypothetical protein
MEGTPDSPREVLPHIQKITTTTKLMCSLLLLHQYGEADRRTLAVSDRIHHQDQDNAAQAHEARICIDV